MPDIRNVAVPNLVGLTQANAEADLATAGLTTGDEATTTTSPTIISGSVVSTSPPSGSYVSAGTPVSLVLSAGPEKVVVPDLGGLLQSDAYAKVQTLGLSVRAETQESSDSLPKGQVIGTVPAAGAAVDAGSSIDLRLSSGSSGGVANPPSTSDKSTTVPHVIGLTQAAADIVLHTAGLSIGAITSGPSNSIPDDGIASVSPPAGTLVSPGSTVSIRLSTGPKTSNGVIWGLSAAGLLAIGLIVALITYRQGGFLASLANKDTARGLITFLIAFTTVVIAVLLMICAMVIGDGGANDRRFDNGKQVLTVLIGVLGTIVGFYFGASDGKGNTPVGLEISTKSLPDAVANKDYAPFALQTVGGTTPFKWTVAPALPADMKLDEARGTIAGAPTKVNAKQKYEFTVSDSATPSLTSKSSLELTVVGQ